MRVVVGVTVFLAGCRSLDSSANYDAIHATPVSVAAAHYYPTGDGRGVETYEVVLRNDTAAPFELSLEFTHFLSVGMRRTRMGKG